MDLLSSLTRSFLKGYMLCLTIRDIITLPGISHPSPVLLNNDYLGRVRTPLNPCSGFLKRKKKKKRNLLDKTFSFGGRVGEAVEKCFIASAGIQQVNEHVPAFLFLLLNRVAALFISYYFRAFIFLH